MFIRNMIFALIILNKTALACCVFLPVFLTGFPSETRAAAMSIFWANTKPLQLLNLYKGNPANGSEYGK